jgi:hypothetical protein
MMRGQTVGVFFLIAMLSLLAADFSVGCGHGYVYGPVGQKFAPGGGQDAAPDRQIAINETVYDVPISFYNKVHVGDTVKFDGRDWTIVKPANSPTPASTPP